MSTSTPRMHEAFFAASELVQIQPAAALRAVAPAEGVAPALSAVKSYAPPSTRVSNAVSLQASVAGGEIVPVEALRPVVKNPPRPGVQLGEIRDFSVGGKHYVFVIPVTGIFGVDSLGAEILRCLRPLGTSTPGQTDAVQVPETLSAPLPELLAAFQPRYTRPQVLQALSELRAIGALDFVGLRDVRLKPPAPQLPPIPFPQRTLVLNLANDCNLGCSYCFAAQGDYGAPRRLMNEETGRKSVDFLLQNSGDHESVTLVFFGGEPLMNFSLLRRMVAYASEAGQKAGKRVEFTMTTNATYLTPEVIQFVSDHAIGVSVSIDGPKKYHDARRTFKGGRGSYDMIYPRVRNLLQNHKTRRVAARVTLTHGVTAVQEIFWHLKEMGFYEVGFAPVTSADQQDYALSPEELWAIQSEFQQLAELYVEKAAQNEYLGFSNLSNLLSELHAGIVKAYPCGAGLGLLGVGADGELYLCHRFLESKEHLMGSVHQGIDLQKQAAFLKRAHLSRKPPCQVCWVRHICAGGCHHEAYTRYGDLHHANTHYCEWIRTWIDLGLQSYAGIMEKNSEFIEYVIERRG